MAPMHSPLTLPTQLAPSAPAHIEVLGWGVLEGLDTARPGLDVDVAWCERRRFKAKPGDSLVAPGEGGHVDVLLGFGPRGHLGTAALRKAGAAFAASTGGAKTAALDLTGIFELGVGTEQAIQATIEGFWGARYRFTRYHAGDPDPLESLTIVVSAEEVSSAERVSNGAG